MKSKVMYLLLVIMILASCAGNRKYDDLMQRADSIMDADDDSAKVAIRMLDGVKTLLPEFTKGQRMRYQLLYHKAMNKAFIPFTSDSIMQEVADYYEHHGSANNQMLAYYVLGCVYRDMHEAPTALEYYNKATEQADTTANDCDYNTLGKVYGQMALLFDKQYLPYEELSAWKNAYKYAFKANDIKDAVRFYQGRQGAYAYLGEIDSAIAVNLNAAKMFKKYGNDNDAAIALGCNYEYYMQQGKYNEAKDAFKSYISTGYKGNLNYEDALAYIYYERGAYYLCFSQLDSAYYYLNQSLKLCKSNGNQAVTARALAQYYSKVNRPALTAEFALKSLDYQDSIFVEMKHSQLQQVHALYNYNRNQRKAILAEKKAAQRDHIIYILIIGSMVLGMFAAFIYRKKMVLKKKRIAATQLLYEDSLLKLKKLQAELLQLQEEQDNKMSLMIREKEEAIGKLKEEVKDIRAKFSNPLLSDADVILRNSSICKKLHYIEMHPKENMVQEDWIALETTVEQLIPSFVPILKEQLNEKEYHICLLVKMGFSTSFIAGLVKLSSSAVCAARKRMLEKLCHKVGTPKDFDEFVRHIS